MRHICSVTHSQLIVENRHHEGNSQLVNRTAAKCLGKSCLRVKGAINRVSGKRTTHSVKTILNQQSFDEVDKIVTKLM